MTPVFVFQDGFARIYKDDSNLPCIGEGITMHIKNRLEHIQVNIYCSAECFGFFFTSQNLQRSELWKMETCPTGSSASSRYPQRPGRFGHFNYFLLFKGTGRIRLVFFSFQELIDAFEIKNAMIQPSNAQNS